MKRIQGTSKRRRGSALLLVLWAVAVMAAAVLGLVSFADFGFAETAAKGRDFRARQFAESGLALGANPKISRHSPLLHRKFPGGGRFDVVVSAEEARLNLNAVLLQQQNAVLLRLFSKWGVKDGDARQLIDVMIDWVSPAPAGSPTGMENTDSARPPHRPFQSLDEIGLIPGIEALTKTKPDWKDFFTLYSDGALDLNEASAELIEAVCDVSPPQAESFVAHRLRSGSSSDAKDDGFVYTDLAQAETALGLSSEQVTALGNGVTLTSQYRRIDSTGSVGSGSYRHLLRVVVKLNASPAQYLSWSE